MAKRNQQFKIKEENLSQKKSVENLSSTLPPSIFTMMKQFLDENKEHQSPNIWTDLMNALLKDFDILVTFVELLFKIKEIKDPQVTTDPLKNVIEDIKQLGRVILDLKADHPSIITTIITKALQPKEEKPSVKANSSTEISGIVKVDPKPGNGILSQFIDWTVDMVLKFLNYGSSKSDYLQHNYRPVDHETPPTHNVTIKGNIPKELKGVMVRNGPNPQFIPVANYGWMDGDSMLHAVYFNNAKATYASRYVKTSRYKQEQKFGRTEFLQYGDLTGSLGVFMACVQLLKQKLGILDMSQGWFNANDGVTYHAGFLMTYEDFDKPYAISVLENGDLETLGVNNYYNKLTHNVISHTKKDSSTGEMFILGSSYTSPYAIYHVICKDGYLGDPVNITLSGPTYLHDLAITKNYIIVMDLSFCFDPENMVKNEAWVYNYDQNKNARFGILPRDAKNEKKIKWFEFKEPFLIFHNANAWEEVDGTITLVTCVLKEPNKSDHSDDSSSSVKIQSKVEAKKNWIFLHPGYVYTGFRSQTKSSNGGSKDEDKNVDPVPVFPTLNKFSFNMTSGKCTRTQLTKTPCDYPKVNESFIGKYSRYVYTSEFGNDGKTIGIVKTDLEWASELKLNLGEGKYSSEVVFVPRLSTSTGEEDGYLTTFVYDEIKNKSFVYVIWAMNMRILATVEIKDIRIPYGFHATFVTSEQMVVKQQTKDTKSAGQCSSQWQN